MDISLSLFAPEHLVSRDGFGRPVSCHACSNAGSYYLYGVVFNSYLYRFNLMARRASSSQLRQRLIEMSGESYHVRATVLYLVPYNTQCMATRKIRDILYSVQVLLDYTHQEKEPHMHSRNFNSYLPY